MSYVASSRLARTTWQDPISTKQHMKKVKLNNMSGAVCGSMAMCATYGMRGVGVCVICGMVCVWYVVCVACGV